MYSQNGLLVFYPLYFLLIHNEWPTTMAKSIPECALLWVVKRERTVQKGLHEEYSFPLPQFSNQRSHFSLWGGSVRRSTEFWESSFHILAPWEAE